MNAPTTIKQDPAKSISALLQSQRKQIELALPKHVDPDRMLRIALTEIRKSRQLQEADPISLLAAIVQCSQLGLEPGSGLGHAYLIPYKREVQLIMGYRGMIELARRSGKVDGIWAYPVFERDEFDCDLGSKPTLHHKPFLKGDAGPMVLVYAAALINGFTQFELKTANDIDETKRRATERKSNSPWFTDFIAMARKTPIRSLFKYLPASAEMAHAVEIDERAEGENSSTFELTNFETGEPITLEMPHTVASAAEVQAHKVSNAISDIWVEAIGLGINPEAVVNMTESDLAAAPESRKQSAIMVLRETIKKRAASK
jgi:recombination protein RecT